MTEQELSEALAEQGHASWARWMGYLLNKFERGVDGSVHLPGRYVQALERQIDAPFVELTTAEQDLDRAEAAYLLPLIQRYVSSPGSEETRPDIAAWQSMLNRTLDLSSYDPTATGGLEREQVRTEMRSLRTRLGRLQRLMSAAGTHSVLIILQGVDTSGKDSVIRHAFGRFEHARTRVTYWRPPSEKERAHDFLWRLHQQTPGRGEVAIWHRSHYEDLLVPHAHHTLDAGDLTARARAINDFELALTESGTLVLKFLLHLSADEQKRRLDARARTAKRSWKLSVADWQESGLWDAYQDAYALVLRRTSTPYAPWHIVPADQKWSRDYFVALFALSVLQSREEGWLGTLHTRHAQLVANGKQTKRHSRKGKPVRPARSQKKQLPEVVADGLGDGTQAGAL